MSEITLVKIDTSQRQAVYDLVLTCLDYFTNWAAKKPTIQEVVDALFHDIPADVAPEAKEVFAVMQAGKMVGLVDLLHDYPRVATSVLGLMILQPDVRHQGVGTFCYQQVEKLCRKRGQSLLRLGVYQNNGVGQRMWQKQGFQEVSQQDSPQGMLLVMEKRLL